MADEPAVGTPAPAAAPATPWHQGIDADLVGAWQNKGYDLSDPVKVAVETGKAWREAEKMIGVPRDQLLRLPQNANDPAAMRAIYERLGAPKDAKDYALETLKYADGDPLEASLADRLRATFHARGVPKDTAIEIAKEVMKEAENEGIAQRTALEGKQRDELARLSALWGAQSKENEAIALAGARRLGLTPDQVKAMEQALGMDGAAELLRKYGSATSEHPYVDGGKSAGTPATAEAAKARLTDLKADKEWSKRLFANPKGPEAREFKNLSEQITGVNEAYELANL